MNNYNYKNPIIIRTKKRRGRSSISDIFVSFFFNQFFDRNSFSCHFSCIIIEENNCQEVEEEEEEKDLEIKEKEEDLDKMQAYQSFNSQAYMPNSAAAAVAAAAYYQHHPQNYVLPAQYSLSDSKMPRFF